MMAPRCAGSPRRRHRNREASETRFAQTADASLSDFGTGDVAPYTGTHVKNRTNCNGNFKSNDNFKSHGNGNCRCAELQQQRHAAGAAPFDTSAAQTTQGERIFVELLRRLAAVLQVRINRWLNMEEHSRPIPSDTPRSDAPARSACLSAPPPPARPADTAA